MKSDLSESHFKLALSIVSRTFNIAENDILSHYRPDHVVRARLALYHILRNYKDEVVAEFVNKDRSTLIHGRKRLWNWMQVDAKLAELVSITDKINK